MAGLGKFIAGGALAGVGAGLVAQAKEKRDLMLEQLRHSNRMDYLRESDRLAGEREAARDDRLLQRQEQADDRRFQRESGLLQSVQQAEDGTLFGITRGGDVVELGIKGKAKSEDLVEIGDEESPTGTRMVPKSEAAGKPGKGTKDMRESIAEREQNERMDARRQAEAEADERDPFGPNFLRPDATKEAYGEGGRASFIERRTNEILSERRGFAARTSGGSGGAQAKPSGAGSRNDPFRATTQQHVEWFKANARPGDVIEVNGRLFTKK